MYTTSSIYLSLLGIYLSDQAGLEALSQGRSVQRLADEYGLIHLTITTSITTTITIVIVIVIVITTLVAL